MKSKKPAENNDTWSNPHPWYNPERDGSLAEYFMAHNGYSVSPLFVGYDWFKRLLKEGWIMPNISNIRIYRRFGFDEHYTVISEKEVEGIEIEFHGGKPGIHDPKNLLTEKGPSWEPIGINTELLYKHHMEKSNRERRDKNEI